ncbi:MAG: homoserine dehydrogenase [candidate division Zixibacteria bacterium]|nr:homoserine dehydrogenase [candidate division Zixibacteria bacterium]MDH3938456.1 homoserine dehydrogenase [candidate division Zixibacteria bacterium]MDH4034534.1 homoserine dehydrogenase [candidate division Zixibacteria bacterium]
MRLLFIGFGTVVQGLSELLAEKATELKQKHGLDLKVVGISDMLKGCVYAPDGIDLAQALEAAKNGDLKQLPNQFEADALAMIDAADADLMVEATYTDIKTGQPATSHIKAALAKGMHVTTTNKGPVALFLQELKKLADANGVKFLYEGTVISGTPLLNLIRETLAGSHISEIKGILNGTTNYILSQMEQGQPYDAVLKKAQELGYAEAVPDADVLGWDALAKITILANAVFGVDAKPDAFSCQGITEISNDAIAEAKANGKRFKLIGTLKRDGDSVVGSVAPVQMDLSHPLAGVMGATNAVTISTDTLGDVTIVGPGAGRVETGYSVLIDIISIGGSR